MLKKLIPNIKEEYPELNTVHYVTDLPTSQYRNKTMYQMVCSHAEEFSVSARLDYLKAGHDTGPCDGLGWRVKRSVDSAIKRRKVVIQSAEDFHIWAVFSEAASVVRNYYVTQEKYESAHTYSEDINTKLKTVPNTMKIHAVVPVSTTHVGGSQRNLM